MEDICENFKLVLVNENVSNFSGAYTPLLVDGNIMVNGVLASCYAYADHDIVHFAMVPMQMYSKAIEWVFGMNKGLPGFVSIAIDLHKWILPQELY